MYIFLCFHYFNIQPKSCLEWFREGAHWIIQGMIWISCRICNHIYKRFLSFKSFFWMIDLDLKYPESLNDCPIIWSLFLCHTLYQVVSYIWYHSKTYVWMIHHNNTDVSGQTEFVMVSKTKHKVNYYYVKQNSLLTMGTVWFWNPRKELYNMKINIIRMFKTKRFPWLVVNCVLHSQ